MDRGAWQATVHRVATSRTELSQGAHTQGRRGRPFPGSRWLAPDSSPVAESSGVIRVPVSLWFFKWSCMVVRVGL